MPRISPRANATDPASQKGGGALPPFFSVPEFFWSSNMTERPEDAPVPVKALYAVPDDTPVDLAAALRDSHVQEVLDKLDRELVGLKPVKTRIRETAALLLVDRVRKELGLAAGA